VVLLYVLFVFSAGYCLRTHESNIEAYYGTKRAILNDAAATELSADERLALLRDQIWARKKFDARLRLLLLLFFVAGLFDFIIYRNGISSFWLAIIILLQTAAVLVFLVQRASYLPTDAQRDLNLAFEMHKGGACDAQREQLNSALAALENKIKFTGVKDKSRKFWHAAWPMMLLVFISAFITIPALCVGNQKLREDWRGAKTTSGNDLGERINKMQKDLQGVQQSFNELQQSNLQLQHQLLDEKLSPYTKRDEAERRFVTREELNRLVESMTTTKK
jgi:uncharacterized protein YlxW (UPF0749 family)